MKYYDRFNYFRLIINSYYYYQQCHIRNSYLKSEAMDNVLEWG